MAIDFSRVQAICFDIDGTLSDTDDVWTDALAARLARFHPRGAGKETSQLARRLIMAAETPTNAAYRLLDRLGLDHTARNLLRRLRPPRPSHARSEAFHLVPGVRSMLADAFERYPLTVVSARDEETSLAFIDQFSLRPFFREIATAATTYYTKPYPDPLLWVAERLGLPPSALLMVGDTTVDVLSAAAAGAQSVAVLCGFGEEAELRAAGAHLILPSTADLTSLFPSPAV